MSRRWLICALPFLGGCISASPIIDKSAEGFDRIAAQDALTRVVDLRKRLQGAKITFTKKF